MVVFGDGENFGDVILFLRAPWGPERVDGERE
jgi:hypothetical protein